MKSLLKLKSWLKLLCIRLNIDTKDGISLLSLKHHLMLSYLQNLVLLSSHRVLGHTLSDRSRGNERQPFSATDRPPLEHQPGDLVDLLIEKRVVLEKVKALESKMRYQIEKLVRLAEETPEEADKNIANGKYCLACAAPRCTYDCASDPLAFRPNPENLMNQDLQPSGFSDEDSDSGDERGRERRDGVYRPPRLEPVPYTEDSGRSKKDKRRRPVLTALEQLSHLDPHIESTSGLGSAPKLQSARARELERMKEYEEENFTRLVMKKKDAKRRRRDEEDIALGGTGANSMAGARGRGRRGIGLEDEFADVLKSVGRRRESGFGDGYEELRQRGKKSDALTRSRLRSREDIEGGDGPKRKKGRFEKDQAALKKVLKRKMQR